MIKKEQLDSREGQVNPLSEKEKSSILKRLNKEITKTQKYSPEKAKNLTRAFSRLLSARVGGSGQDLKAFFFRGMMGKQVIDFFADIQYAEENLDKIVDAYLELYSKRNLNITTMYFFNEMIRNGMGIESAKRKILEIGEYINPACDPKRKESIKSSLKEVHHLPRLLEDVDAYAENREAFNKKVEAAVEKNRTRGQLHFVALKGDIYQRSTEQYFYYDYEKPLPGVDSQDIDGKTPLHYAIERAAEYAKKYEGKRDVPPTDTYALNVANRILGNERGYSTAAVKDDSGRTPRELVATIENAAVRRKFNELFEAADKRQRILQACKQICSDLDKKFWGGHEKKRKIQTLMKGLQNVTTTSECNIYLGALDRVCKERRVFNFHFFESMREEAQSLQTLNRLMKPDSSTLSREEVEGEEVKGKKGPGKTP